MVDPSLLGWNQDRAVAAVPPGSEAKQDATIVLAEPPAVPRQPLTTAGEAIGNEPGAGAPAPPSAGQVVAKSAPLPAKAPAAVSASTATIEQPRKKENPPVAKPLEPPLDLAALKARRCGTCRKWTTTECAVAWMDGEDCVQGAGDHDDYCPYWEARP